MKKYFIHILLCSLSMVFTATTCRDSDDNYETIRLDNQSGEPIYFFFWWEKDFNPIDYYTNHPGISSLFYYLDNKEENKQGCALDNDDYYIYVIVKKSTMDKYTIDEIKEKNIYDTIYAYTYNELDKMNFKITYTGE